MVFFFEHGSRTRGKHPTPTNILTKSLTFRNSLRIATLASPAILALAKRVLLFARDDFNNKVTPRGIVVTNRVF